MGPTETFIERFTELWAEPDPARFPELFHPGATLRHPGMTEPLDTANIAAYIGELQAQAPDIRLVPTDWAQAGDVLFIHFTMSATLGGERVEWGGVDRFALDGDRAVDVVAYFDTLPLWVRLDPTMQRPSMVEFAASRSAATASAANGPR